jgi:DNA-binding XRE family transcriptional regulator
VTHNAPAENVANINVHSTDNRTGMRACNRCSIEKAIAIRDPRLPNPIRTVGDHIRSRRVTEGLTQAEVADGIGVTPTALGQWETNKRASSDRFLSRIRSFLGYNPEVPLARLKHAEPH